METAPDPQIEIASLLKSFEFLQFLMESASTVSISS